MSFPSALVGPLPNNRKDGKFPGHWSDQGTGWIELLQRWNDTSMADGTRPKKNEEKIFFVQNKQRFFRSIHRNCPALEKPVDRKTDRKPNSTFSPKVLLGDSGNGVGGPVSPPTESPDFRNFRGRTIVRARSYLHVGKPGVVTRPVSRKRRRVASFPGTCRRSRPRRSRVSDRAERRDFRSER